jgi:dephospho-CoA kinase
MIIGLTGGIGSGKSIVAKVFELLGCSVFNSDQEALRVYFNPEIRQQIIDLLGKESYCSANSINRRYISSLIFNDESLRLKLNQIIHPAVGKSFQLFLEKQTSKIVIKETALLFEANLQGGVQKVVFVTAPLDLRISRVMLRDHLSREEVMKKINSQLPEKEKESRSHFIINNNEQEFLIHQVLNVYSALLNA